MMQEQEKLALLEETMDLDEGDLSAEMRLEEIDEWDSMAKLSLIVLMDEEFGKKISGAQIGAFETVQDILAFMG